METQELIALGAFLLAAASIFVAGAANRQSGASNTIAEEARDVAKEALGHERRYAPPPWGEVERVDERTFKVSNKSGRHIKVVSLEGTPEDSADAVNFRCSPHECVDYGDAIYFTSTPSITQDPRGIAVKWCFADGDEHEPLETMSRFFPR